MAIAKLKPCGSEWESFVRSWSKGDHQSKLDLAAYYGVVYNTARHWISDSGSAQPRARAEEASFSVSINVPAELRTKSGVSTALVLGDFHIPFQDPVVLGKVEEFMAELKPDYLIYNGDINDFYQVSDFSKDPVRLSQLQDDLDITTTMFARHRSILPEADMIVLAGTHEQRWLNYLMNKSPALVHLREASVSSLYALEPNNIRYVPYEQGLLVNGTFLILHGDIASKHSSATAKAQYEKCGGNGLCSHTHRGGSFFKRDRFGTYGWYENFCLCSLNPDWIQNPNWQQGFSVVTFVDSGRFFVEQVPVISQQFIYGGKMY